MKAGLLDAALSRDALFLGEAISDVYHYGRLLARPVKEPIVAIETETTERFSGGIIAAASHARPFVKSCASCSTVHVTKERFVSSGHYRKLFEAYSGKMLLDTEIVSNASDYDITAVIDYGHGMMTPQLIDRVCGNAKYLAVNVQTNAGNYGFNLATKYPRADYLCMDELEARLATQNRDGSIALSLEILSAKYPKIVITLGKQGAIGWTEETGIVAAPALTDRVVDTMGAGDAFFAVTAVLAQTTPLLDLLRIGNAAGALKAQILGHQRAITKEELSGYLRDHP